MVLPTKKLLIMVQVPSEADLVAGGAKLGRAHERFEKGFLVKLGLALDQLLIDVLQQAIRAIGERVMDRLVNGVIRIAFGAVDVGDGMTGGTGNAGLRSRMIYVVKFRIVERAAKEGHDIVTAGAPARGFYAAIPFK